MRGPIGVKGRGAVLSLAAAAVVALAAAVQRLTGLGFALVATPLIVLLMGPIDGVLTVTVVGFFVSLVLLAMMFRDVDWRRTLVIVGAGALASPLAALVIAHSSTPLLLLGVGCAGVLALVAGRLSLLTRNLRGAGGAAATGFAGGFLHVTSGLSGPPLIAYGVNDQWERQSFVASLQAIFIGYHAITVAWRGFPSVSYAQLGWLLCAAAAGTLIGVIAERWVRPAWSRIGMFAIAWIGTSAVLLRGIWVLIVS